jgi:hypothetical protein
MATACDCCSQRLRSSLPDTGQPLVKFKWICAGFPDEGQRLLLEGFDQVPFLHDEKLHEPKR